MYKKLIPMLTMVISSQAFAEPEYPFGHPFDAHLYSEGLDLAMLSNGRYYDDREGDPYRTIFGRTSKSGVIPGHFFNNHPDGSKSITIKEESWNIVWVENENEIPSPLSSYPPSVQDQADRDEGRKAFFNIDCSLEDVDAVFIKDLHINNDITYHPTDPTKTGTNHPVPYRTLSISNCPKVSIKDSSFKGPVAYEHIDINDCGHIYIDNIEISGTADPSETNSDGSPKYYLGGGISIYGGDQNEGVVGTYSTIIKNSYIHDFTNISEGMITAVVEAADAVGKPPSFNYDASGIRSPGTGIYFNNYIENHYLDDSYTVTNKSGLEDGYYIYISNKAPFYYELSLTGLDVGHSRGDTGAYGNKIFKVERNIFDDVKENKISGRFGLAQENKLLFSNNVYFNSTWKDYFCNTEVVFAFESYFFEDRTGVPSHNLLKYGGCPRNGVDTDNDGIDDEFNLGAELMPVTRYNTHYYFEENRGENDVPVRPTALNLFNAWPVDQTTPNPDPDPYHIIDASNNRSLANPVQLIWEDYNTYSFSTRFTPYSNIPDATQKPHYWIQFFRLTNSNGTGYLDLYLLEDPNLTEDDFHVQKIGSSDALTVYKNKVEAYHQGEYSTYFRPEVSFEEEESAWCTWPMFDAKKEWPIATSIPSGTLPDNKNCDYLKVAGSLDAGYPYLHNAISLHNYPLFQRDFYGNSRMGSDVSVGAFQ